MRELQANSFTFAITATGVVGLGRQQVGKIVIAFLRTSNSGLAALVGLYGESYCYRVERCGSTAVIVVRIVGIEVERGNSATCRRPVNRSAPRVVRATVRQLYVMYKIVRGGKWLPVRYGENTYLVAILPSAAKLIVRGYAGAGCIVVLRCISNSIRLDKAYLEFYIAILSDRDVRTVALYIVMTASREQKQGECQ